MSSSVFYTLGERMMVNFQNLPFSKNVVQGSHDEGKEPLQLFSRAKQDVVGIYENLGKLVIDVLNVYSDIDKGNRAKFLSNDVIQEVMNYWYSIESIRGILRRDKMKVVFFGGTSNGKSTLINAMLGKDILPSGVGTTTCCFLQVEGGDGNEAYFVMEGNENKMKMDQLEKAADALDDENVGLSTKGKNALFKIVYPKADAQLLQNDVLIMDSPGMGVDGESDGWIDKHCLDADLFVLVYNAESALSNVEKEFMRKVKEKIACPNVFILCNKWDVSDQVKVDRLSKLRQKHETDMSTFCNELSLGTPSNTFFFVSGAEMLAARCNSYEKECGRYKSRKEDFLRFENSLKQRISVSAINTKVESHVHRATEIRKELLQKCKHFHTEAIDEQKRLIDEIRFMEKQLDNWCKAVYAFSESYENQKKSVRLAVKREVSHGFEPIFAELDSGLFFNAFKCEIRKDSQSVAYCEQQLISYIEQKCRMYMESRYSIGLLSNVRDVARTLFDQIKGICEEQHEAALNKFWANNQQLSWISSSETVGSISERMQLRKAFDPEYFRKTVSCGDTKEKYSKKLEKYLRDNYRPLLKSKLQLVMDDQARKCEEQIVGDLDKVFDGLISTVDEIHYGKISSISSKTAERDKMSRAIVEIDAATRLSIAIGHEIKSFEMNFL